MRFRYHFNIISLKKKKNCNTRNNLCLDTPSVNKIIFQFEENAQYKDKIYFGLRMVSSGNGSINCGMTMRLNAAQSAASCFEVVVCHIN